MAYWINEKANIAIGSSRQIPFLMDSDTDVQILPHLHTPGVQQGQDTISNLPVGAGSYARSISSSKVFILDSNDIWVEQVNSGGGGGGGGEDIATDQEIQDMIDRLHSL